MPPIYPEAELERSGGASMHMHGDEYYGKALASVVRMVLEARKSASIGPATVNEIYDAMVKGGYQFETRIEDNAQRGLRVSLSKNTTVFHRLPSGKYGLTEWYPAVKEKDPNSKKHTAVPEVDGSEPRETVEAEELEEVGFLKKPR